MKALTRNCLHGSEIYFLEEDDPGSNTQAIYKSSSSQEGVKNLKQELEGFRWYKQRNNHPISVAIARETPHYLSVKYGLVEGIKVPFRHGYFRNKKWVHSILEHYCSIWGALPKREDGLYPLHGDLSLDNVVFTNAGPVILDWEHFSMNTVPLGFDGLYILFESLWFESKNGKVHSNSLDHLAGTIQLLRSKNSLGERFFVDPLRGTIQFIKSNLRLWGTQLTKFPNKLPILQFKEDIVTNIDGKLNALFDISKR